MLSAESNTIPSHEPVLRLTRGKTILFIFAVFLAVALFGWWSTIKQEERLRSNLLSETRMASKAINVQHVKSLTASVADLASPNYQRLKEQISSIRTANPRQRFIYLLGQRPDKSIFFFVDSEPPDSKDYSPPGQDYTEAPDSFMQVFANGNESVAGPVEDRWGKWISAMVPVIDPRTGKLLALCCIDIDAGDWNRKLAIAVAEQMALFLMFVAPLAVFLILRHRNQYKLIESRQYLSDIIQFYPDATMVIDNQGKVTAWNRAMEEFSGVKVEEIIGKGDYEYALPFYGERRPMLVDLVMLPQKELEDKYAKIERRNSTLTAEAYIHNARGEALYFHGTAATLRNSRGEIIGAIESVRDISGRKRAEEKLAKQARLSSLRADIGAALGQNRDLRGILQQCAELLVQYLDVAFFRIWTLNDAEQMLEMQASAGMYTHIDGPHDQVPVGMSKIGMIASERQPHLTNDVVNDPRIVDREWARQEGMIAFAGYPLIVADHLVGVMACFARTALNEEILGELGSVAGTIAQCIEHKRAEAEVNFKNLILSTQQECTLDGILVVNNMTTIISCNRRFVEMWGIPPELVETGINEPVLQFVAKQPVDEEGFLAQVRHLYEHPEEKSREEFVLKDGRVFDRYSAPMTGPDGAYYGRVWYFSDVTARKHLEEEMNTSRDVAKEYAQRLEFALEASNDATWEWNMIDDQCVMNARFYEMMEYAPGEVDINFDLLMKTIHPDDVYEMEKTLTELMRDKSCIYAVQCRIVTKTGKLRHVMVKGKIVMYDEDGHPIKMAGVITDVTEMKRLSDEVNRINNLESIGLLSGGLAHDFNNVLNIIYGNITFVKMLAEGNAALVEPLTDAEEACERAKALGTRLQAFSQEGIPLREPITLPALIEDAAEALFKGSRISHGISAADNVHQLEAAPRQIRQLFENLLSNAKDAMTGGGTVRINIENCEVDGKKELSLRSGPYVCITIQDDGSGIPEENLLKIFDPYFSTKDTYSQRGMGLGLSICHAIMKRHNGQITVESTVGIGTRVTLYLPASVEEAEHPAEEKH
ncbi:MAG: ATP-binding protein [Desulfuromonadaceae bacterium]|nr:ATP-binding protein [Desulfuromonadaceae bacterium]MDD2847264.1 ATP-binding protein [Desulfuromonadaceae bacterium]MDD4130208.1 ATP-binding protein [Desulfuromonadaceae bacterium]